MAFAGPGSDAPAVLTWVDGHKGKELRSMTLSYPVTQSFSLPITDSSEQRLHLFIDKQQKAHLFPNTEESFALFVKQKANAYFYEVDEKKGTIEGYGIRDQVQSSDAKEDYVFASEKLWSIVFPAETEAIAAVVTRRSDEVSQISSLVVKI